jgi:hypothetical protein
VESSFFWVVSMIMSTLIRPSCKLIETENKTKNKLWDSGSVSELASASIIHPRDPVFKSWHSQNIFSFCLCHIWIQLCRLLAVEHYLLIYWSIILDPTRQVAKTLNHNMYLKCVLIQLTMLNKDRHTAKSITFKKI